MPDRAAVALALASAAFVSVPASLLPQHARAQEPRRRVARRRVGIGPIWDLVLAPRVSNGNVSGSLAGGVTFQQPLGRTSAWGIHGEGGVSFSDPEFFGQAVLFVRDPTIGEIGVLAGFAASGNGGQNGDTTARFGLEGEYYIDRVTLGGSITFQGGGGNDYHWDAQVGLKYYPIDNLKLSLAGLFQEHGGVGASVGVEYQPEGTFLNSPNTQVAWFANASYAQDVGKIKGGLRFTWGGNGSSLLYADRYQRKDFPGSIVGSWGVHMADVSVKK